MATYTWIADAPGGNWTTTANWSTDDLTPTYPGTGDTAVFDSAHVGNCTVDVAIATPTSVSDSGSYTGTLTLTNALSTGTGGFSWTKGTLAGTGTLNIGRDCNLSGCTFSCGAGQTIAIAHSQVATNTLTANQTLQNVTITRSGSSFLNYAFSGTFTIGGNLTINLQHLNGTATVTITGDMTFNSSVAIMEDANLALTVNGTLYLTAGSFTAGTITANGAVTAAAAWPTTVGGGIINWAQTGDITFTPQAGVLYPTMKFTSARTVTLGAALYCYDLYLSSGATLLTANYTLKLVYLDIVNMVGTFTYGTSEFNFYVIGNNQYCRLGTGTYTQVRVSGTTTHTFEADLRGACSIGTLILEANCHQAVLTDSPVAGWPTVTTLLDLNAGAEFSAGTITLTGNLDVDAGYTLGGGGTVDWTQAGNITWSTTGGLTAWLPKIIFDSDRTVTLGDNVRFINTVLTNGTLDVSASNYQVHAWRWDSSATSVSRPGFNPRTGTVTLYAFNTGTWVGADDASGCPFYDLVVTPSISNGNSSTNKFDGCWNVSHDLTVSIKGQFLPVAITSSFTVLGVTTFTDTGAGSLELGTGAATGTATMNLNHLTINTCKWYSASTAILIINCTGDVDLNVVTGSQSYVTINMNGTGSQSFDADTTTVMPANLTINKASGTATITNIGTYIENLTVTAGKLSFSPGTAGKTYKFITGKTTTVSSGATLSFDGISNIKMVTLREKDDGASTWAITNSAGSSVLAYYADIKKSVASRQWAYAYNSIDSGSNVNWSFGRLLATNISVTG